MFRMTRIVPTTVLTVAMLALAAPAAQARPFIAPSGGVAYQGVHSTLDWAIHRGTPNHAVVVTTGDKPLANPIELPNSAGLRHAATETMNGGVSASSTTQVKIDKVTTTPVNVSDPSENGFDWTAAAIGAGLGGILMLMLAASVGFHRRGQLTA